MERNESQNLHPGTAAMIIGKPIQLVDCAVVLFLLLFPHFVPLPFYSYAIVCVLVILFYQRWKKRSLADLGLVRGANSMKVVVVGLISAAILTAFMQFIYIKAIFYFFDVPGYTEYNFIQGDPVKLLISIAAAWIIGGFYEELVFRGFIHHALQDLLPHKKYSFWTAGILTSILFGMYHWQQGIYGVVSSVIGGLYWTYLFRRYKENLWYPIVSHAIFDTIALTLIYYGLFGK